MSWVFYPSSGCLYGTEDENELLSARLNCNVQSLQDAKSLARHVETVLDQIKHLRQAVTHTLERAKGPNLDGKSPALLHLSTVTRVDWFDIQQYYNNLN